MTLAVVIFFIGLLLSAFFSGSETGLYRVSPTRLVLDGLDGSAAARGIVWLLNNPSIFVATTLVGNNVANYLTSMAVVMGVSTFAAGNASAELAGPMLMTPMVFVFGELLPKHLFYQAPYRLLKSTRVVLIAAAVLFAPVTIFLGLLGVVLRLITGRTPFQVRLGMGRQELDQVLLAGQEAGLLADGQRQFSHRLFEIGNVPAMRFGVPLDRLASVQADSDAAEARQEARRCNHPIVLVRRSDEIIGFAHYADLSVGGATLQPSPVVRGKVTDRHLEILLALYDARSEVAVLTDDNGQAVTIVTRRQLLIPLIKA